MKAIFLTHADVVIDPKVPVPEWPLNDTGRRRHARFAHDPVLAGVRAIFCSAERKALDGAEITAAALGLAPRMRGALGENDRSATGYLPGAEFQAMADAFFAQPHESVRGWERAVDAQARIVGAVRAALADAPEGDVLFVAHGGVAALLRCHLLGVAISRSQDQLGTAGGCWFSFDTTMTAAPSDWSLI